MRRGRGARRGRGMLRGRSMRRDMARLSGSAAPQPPRPSAPPLGRQAVAPQGGWAVEPRANGLLRGGALPLLHAAQGAAPAPARRHRAVRGVRGAPRARRGERAVRRLVGARAARAVRQAHQALRGQERRPGDDDLRGEDRRAAAAGTAHRAPSRLPHRPARRTHGTRTPRTRLAHGARTHGARSPAQAHLKMAARYLVALRDGMAAAWLLNRTFVFPMFECMCDRSEWPDVVRLGLALGLGLARSGLTWRVPACRRLQTNPSHAPCSTAPTGTLISTPHHPHSPAILPTPPHPTQPHANSTPPHPHPTPAPPRYRRAASRTPTSTFPSAARSTS